MLLTQGGSAKPMKKIDEETVKSFTHWRCHTQGELGAYTVCSKHTVGNLDTKGPEPFIRNS